MVRQSLVHEDIACALALSKICVPPLGVGSLMDQCASYKVLEAMIPFRLVMTYLAAIVSKSTYKPKQVSIMPHMIARLTSAVDATFGRSF